MNQFIKSFQDAYNFLLAGENDKALEQLTVAENFFIGSNNSGGVSKEDICILRGTIAMAKEDSTLAQNSFEEALKLNPNSVEAALGLGQLFFYSEMYDEAEVMFSWVKDNTDGNNVAEETLRQIQELRQTNTSQTKEQVRIFYDLFDTAYSLFMEDKYDEALNSINELQKQYDEEVNILKGNIYLVTEKHQEAKKVFEIALKVNPLSSAACNGLAEYYYKRGNPEDAKIFYERAVQNNPDDQFALLGLAQINNELGLSPDNNTTNFFSKAQIGDEISIILNTAYKYFSEKNHNAALGKIEEFEYRIKTEGKEITKEMEASVFNFKGFNYLSLNQNEKAREVFEKALEINHESSQACAGLGEIFYLETEDEKAKAMFEWAVKYNPCNVFAINGLSKINLSLGFKDDHNSLLFGINKNDSNEFNLFVTEAYEKFTGKQYIQALDLISKAEKFVDKASNNLDTNKTECSLENFKGFCYLSLNNIDEARVSFEKALEKNPKSSQACAGLGEIFYLEEKDDEAREMYVWAIRNEPLNKFALSGLEKVKNNLTENLNTNDEQKKITDKVSLIITEAYEQFSKKQFKIAVKQLENAEELLQKNFTKEENFFAISGINNFMGFNYLGLFQNDKAKECYEKALELNPESSQAAAGLGEILYQEKDDEGAKLMFEWAVKYNPENKYANAGLIKVNKLLGFAVEDNSLIIK